jgi:Zn ribbon nucleic-acid-binding protein
VWQQAILAISRHARTVLVPEYYTSAKCPACRIDGNVFLKEDASTRSLHCARCGTTWPRDVAAAVNLENVVRQWMVDGTRPAYLDSSTAWRFTHGTDPVAWSTLSQEELEKMKGFTTPQQFIDVFEAMLDTEAVARTARYGAGGKRAARGKRAVRVGTRARAGADGDDDDDDDDDTDVAAPTGKPATLKRRARRRRRRERDKGVVDPAPATADTPPATQVAASAADAATTTTAPAAAAAAPSSTAASATVPTGFREAAGPSAPSSSSTTSAQHHKPILWRPTMPETGESH